MSENLRAVCQYVRDKKVPCDAPAPPPVDKGVQSIQKGLQKLGYYSGAPTGVMDQPTKDAIKKLQKVWELPTTGELDSKTQVAFGKALGLAFQADLALANAKMQVEMVKANAEKAKAEAAAKAKAAAAEAEKNAQARAAVNAYFGVSDSNSAATPAAGADSEDGSWVAAAKAEKAKQEEQKRKAEAWIAEKQKAAAPVPGTVYASGTAYAGQNRLDMVREVAVDSAKAMIKSPGVLDAIDYGLDEGIIPAGMGEGIAKPIKVLKGARNQLAEKVVGMVEDAADPTKPHDPVDQAVRVYTECKKQEGATTGQCVQEGVNAVNPVYHGLVHAHQAIEAAKDGNWEEFGARGLDVLDNVGQVIAIADGAVEFTRAVGGGGVRGAGAGGARGEVVGEKLGTEPSTTPHDNPHSSNDVPSDASSPPARDPWAGKRTSAPSEVSQHAHENAQGGPPRPPEDLRTTRPNPEGIDFSRGPTTDLTQMDVVANASDGMGAKFDVVAPKGSGKLDPKRHLRAEHNLTCVQGELEAEQNYLHANPEHQPVNVVKTKPPPLPPEIARDLKKLPEDADFRADELKEMMNRPGLEPAVAEYLKNEWKIAESKANKGASRAAKQKVGNLEAQKKLAEAEYAKASKGPNDIMSARGKNYNNKVKNTPFDQVMGEGQEPWKAHLARIPKDRWPGLQPDHFYPTSQIAKSEAMKNWMKVYEKAPPALREKMELALKDIGDIPENLFSMQADANMHWKNGKTWSELSWTPEVEKNFRYTKERVKAMQTHEAGIKDTIHKAINKQAADFLKESNSR